MTQVSSVARRSQAEGLPWAQALCQSLQLAGHQVPGDTQTRFRPGQSWVLTFKLAPATTLVGSAAPPPEVYFGVMGRNSCCWGF